VEASDPEQGLQPCGGMANETTVAGGITAYSATELSFTDFEFLAVPPPGGLNPRQSSNPQALTPF
jgi:hypothetical protein